MELVRSLFFPCFTPVQFVKRMSLFALIFTLKMLKWPIDSVPFSFPRCFPVFDTSFKWREVLRRILLWLAKVRCHPICACHVKSCQNWLVWTFNGMPFGRENCTLGFVWSDAIHFCLELIDFQENLPDWFFATFTAGSKWCGWKKHNFIIWKR